MSTDRGIQKFKCDPVVLTISSFLRRTRALSDDSWYAKSVHPEMIKMAAASLYLFIRITEKMAANISIPKKDFSVCVELAAAFSDM